MKNFRVFAVLAFAFSFASAMAQTADTTEASEGSSGDGRFPFEFETQISVVGDTDVARGFRNVHDMDEVYTLARFVYTPRTKVGILRLGFAHERWGFSMPADFEVPGGLQSLSAIVGFDTRLGDSLLLRFEMQPGLYSGTKLDSGDFHVPFILGGTYIFSSEFQLVFGVGVDYERDFPVFPGLGVRWRLGPKWVLNAVVPTPRLEYELNQDFTFYVGADLKGSTFRVDDRFGTQRGNPKLNNAIITYTEIRVGGGFQWKIAPGIKVSLEGGYMPYQEFDFHRTDVRYHHEEGGAYGLFAVNASF